MSTVNGLPAHILLNHFVVVLGPLTAILAIICALWPAARRRLIWLVLLLAVVSLALTPLTVNSVRRACSSFTSRNSGTSSGNAASASSFQARLRSA